jgi:hypothetical protein
MANSLRIRRASADAAPSAPNGGNDYLARLVKLVPGEVLALYLTFKGVVSPYLGIWALVCFVLVIIVRLVATREGGKPPQVAAAIIAAVSFVFWIYGTGGYFLNFQLPTNSSGIVSAAIGVWTFVVPLFYKGD